jgi:hypothetical protein
MGELDKTGKALSLRWNDLQAQEYEVQFSRDANFESTKTLLDTKKTVRPELSVLNLDSGKHYVRYRAIESDGFVGNWSSTMEAEIPSRWPPSMWMILGWALIGL